MTSPSEHRAPGAAAFELDSFEQVTAGAGIVLLRVAGRWRAETGRQLGRPTLIVRAGRREQRLDALPEPDAVPPVASPNAPPWRAAFCGHADLMAAERVAFALEAGAAIVDLPQPEDTRADRLRRELDRLGAAPMRGGAEPIVRDPHDDETERLPDDLDPLAVEMERLAAERDVLARQLAEALETRAEMARRLEEELEGRVQLERLLAHQVEARNAAEARGDAAERALTAAEKRLADAEARLRAGAEAAELAAAAAEERLAAVEARLRAEAEAGGLPAARRPVRPAGAPSPAPPRRPGRAPSPGTPPGSLPAEWMLAAALMALGVVVVLLLLSGALGAIF